MGYFCFVFCLAELVEVEVEEKEVRRERTQASMKNNPSRGEAGKLVNIILFAFQLLNQLKNILEWPLWLSDNVLRN